MPYNTVSERLFEKTLRHSVPLTAVLELTRNCPLACMHCYLPETGGRAEVKKKEELSAGEWKSVLDSLVQAGCLSIVFTGGEPLSRKDFTEIYLYARESAFDVRLFTSGWGLTEKTADIIARTGISRVEISVYGREKLHDKITGKTGSFRVSVKAASAFKKRGVKVKLKCPLMKENAGQRGFVIELAKINGYEFGFDGMLAPANDRDKNIVTHRMTGRQARSVLRDARLSDGASASGINSSRPALRRPGSQDIRQIICSAGRNICAINPYGEIYPCLQLPVSAGNVRERDFCDIWNNSRELKKIRAMRFDGLKQCPVCFLRKICGRCPGFAMLEDGDISGPSKAACNMARLRYEIAEQQQKKQ